MTNEKIIYTLDARGNILLEVMQGCLEFSTQQIFQEINNSFNELLEILTTKEINYQKLRYALVRDPKKNEVALVFDRTRIESSCYGQEVFKKIVPIFDRRSTHSVLCGDYIGNNKLQEKLKRIFFQNVETVRPICYKDSHQFFIVYINNLSNKMAEDFRNNILSYEPYVGFVNLNCSSPMKTYLSFILCHIFIKNQEAIIMAHEDDRDNTENVNMLAYPFEEHCYSCKSIQSSLYGLFLSYKIERPVFAGFESDTLFSINAITPDALSLTDFDILLKDEKFEHLKEKKEGSLKKAGMLNLEKNEVEKLIREIINNNYIYNLSYLSEHDTVKFNIMIEMKASDTEKLVKLTLALKYEPKEKILELVTMY